MPTSLADALADRLLEHLPADRAYDWSDLKEASVPPSLAHFLQKLLLRRVEIEQEDLKVPRLPWLDHEHEEVRRAEEALLEAVHRHARIPALAWEEAVRHAASEVSAYLVRPAETLGRFVFGTDGPEHDDGQEDERPVGMILRRLGYFSDYSYLRRAASTYIEQKDLQVLSRARFAALLARVDEQMTADHDTNDWLTLLEPLYQLSETAYPNRAGVSAQLLLDFFEQKKAERPLQRLRAARREQNPAALSRDALRDVLTPAPEAPDEEAAADAPSEAPSEAEQAEEAPPEEAPPEEARGPVPLWQQFQSAPAEASPEDAPSTDPPARETPGTAGDGAADEEAPRPRWQQFQTAAPRGDEAGDPAPSDARPLEAVEKRVLGYAAKSRSLFVRHLFGGSEEAYEHVLRRIEAAETWQAATKVIARDVFRAHKVNIYSDPARSFTDAVEARYR